YFLKNHLMSTQVVFKDGGSGVAEVVSQHQQYPFGYPMKGDFTTNFKTKRLYNFKESVSDFGLGWMDFGARYYTDGAVPVFVGVDPIGENFAWVNGYNYAENEPVGHIDLWGLQKYKPKGQRLDGPRDLLSMKMLNNVWEGAKTMTREFFTSEVGNALKTGGDVVEYGGLAIGATGNVEVSAPTIAAGKAMDLVGTGIIIIDELLETNSLSTETKLDVSADIILNMLPEPLEKPIDDLKLGEAATTVFKSNRDALLKATEDLAKEVVIEASTSNNQSQIAETENCKEKCNN
ncbi:MAG: RHS repeat-associated core domain-containing protein, partial [Bacteroidota bacterium]